MIHNGSQCIHAIAVQSGNREILEYILENFDLQQHYNNGELATSLFNTVHSHIQMDRKRSNCDATSEMFFRNELELIKVVRAGNNSLVRQILVENSLNPKIENQTKSSALTKAAREGHDSIVKLLLDSGASLDPSALAEAARYSCFSTVPILLREIPIEGLPPESVYKNSSVCWPVRGSSSAQSNF